MVDIPTLNKSVNEFRSLIAENNKRARELEKTKRAREAKADAELQSKITQLTDKIEKAAKKSKPNYVVYSNKNQGSLWSGGFTRQMNGWGHYIDQEEVKYNEAYEKMQDAQKLYDAKKMSKKEFKRIEKEWEKFENDFHGVI